MRGGRSTTDSCGLASIFRDCKVVDLDKVRAQGKHADLLLFCGDTAVIIEETSTLKIYDAEQIIQTSQDLRARREAFRVASDPRRVVGVVHQKRRASSIDINYLHYVSKKWGFAILIANCCKDLIMKLGQQLRIERR